MIAKAVLIYIEFQAAVKTPEKFNALLVGFFNDDGIFVTQVFDVGKSGTEHRVCGDKSTAAFSVVFLESVFYRGDVCNYAILRQERINLPENPDGIMKAYCIDQQVRLKIPDLLEAEKPVRVKEVLQPGLILVDYAHLIIKTKGIYQP